MALHVPRIRSQGLTWRLARYFLAISLIVLFISASFGLVFSVRSQEETLRVQLSERAKDAASEVRNFIDDAEAILDQAQVINALAESPERRSLTLNTLLGREPEIRELLLVDAEGAMLEHVSRSRTEILMPGLDIASVLEKTRRGERYVSDVEFDPVSSEPLVRIAVPTENIFREPVGALVAEVNLKFMWDLVSQLDQESVGSVYVVDKTGHLIAHRDTSRVLQQENVANVEEVRDFLSQEVNDIINIGKGIDGQYTVADHGRLPEFGWGVIVEIDVVEAYRMLIEEIGYVIALTIICGIFAVTSAVYFSRRLTSGIVELNRGAQELAKGNLQTRITPASHDEVGQLAESFNTMANALQETYSHLDALVKEKTTALTSQVDETNKAKSAILNLLEDVEEEKVRAENLVQVRTRELREEKARLIASINSLSFGFLIANAQDEIILQNPALTKILDLPSAPHTIRDLTGTFTIMASEGVNSQNFDPVASCHWAMDSRKVVELKEVRHGAKSLRIFCVPILADIVESDGADEVIGYVFLVEDITEAKIAERSRDEFFAVASHELRTPLTAIRGNTDMILDMYADKIPDSDMKEMLRDINTASVRLIDIVNDFLEVSRLEQGKVEIHKESFDVVNVIERVVRDLRGTVEQKGVQLIFEKPQEALPIITSDKNRVEQIILNLVGNALKFTKVGNITIKLENNGTFLRVRVADTGIGIAPENQALLFRKFQQAGDKMLARDVTQGTGLGLYICKLILSFLGGTIELEKSEPGKGSVFAFTLPLNS